MLSAARSLLRGVVTVTVCVLSLRGLLMPWGEIPCTAAEVRHAEHRAEMLMRLRAREGT